MFTPFFYHGELSLISCFNILMMLFIFYFYIINFLFIIFFLKSYRFSSRLEEHSFKGNSIEFLFTLLISSIVILVSKQ